LIVPLQSSIDICLVDPGLHCSLTVQITEEPSCKGPAQRDPHRNKQRITASDIKGGEVCEKRRATKAGDQATHGAGEGLHRQNKHLHRTSSHQHQGNFPHQITNHLLRNNNCLHRKSKDLSQRKPSKEDLQQNIQRSRVAARCTRRGKEGDQHLRYKEEPAHRTQEEEKTRNPKHCDSRVDRQLHSYRDRNEDCAIAFSKEPAHRAPKEKTINNPKQCGRREDQDRKKGGDIATSRGGNLRKEEPTAARGRGNHCGTSTSKELAYRTRAENRTSNPNQSNRKEDQGRIENCDIAISKRRNQRVKEPTPKKVRRDHCDTPSNRRRYGRREDQDHNKGGDIAAPRRGKQRKEEPTAARGRENHCSIPTPKKLAYRTRAKIRTNNPEEGSRREDQGHIENCNIAASKRRNKRAKEPTPKKVRRDHCDIPNNPKRSGRREDQARNKGGDIATSRKGNLRTKEPTTARGKDNHCGIPTPKELAYRTREENRTRNPTTGPSRRKDQDCIENHDTTTSKRRNQRVKEPTAKKVRRDHCDIPNNSAQGGRGGDQHFEERQRSENGDTTWEVGNRRDRAAHNRGETETAHPKKHKANMASQKASQRKTLGAENSSPAPSALARLFGEDEDIMEIDSPTQSL
jgi:hypothetical protein